jgi:KDO2-lipid IV(A) lauroyltransferase
MAKHGKLQIALEYALARSVLSFLGLLPRPAAIGLGRALGRIAYWLPGKLRRTGERNLKIAFPEMNGAGSCADALTAWAGCSASLASFPGQRRKRCAS